MKVIRLIQVLFEPLRNRKQLCSKQIACLITLGSAKEEHTLITQCSLCTQMTLSHIALFSFDNMWKCNSIMEKAAYLIFHIYDYNDSRCLKLY